MYLPGVYLPEGGVPFKGVYLPVVAPGIPPRDMVPSYPPQTDTSETTVAGGKNRRKLFFFHYIYVSFIFHINLTDARIGSTT